MITVLKSLVPAGIKGMTVERYIARAWPLLSAGRINTALSEKQLRVNGVKSGSAEVNGGDEICLYIDGKMDFSLEVLFEDDRLIAICKPAGLPVDTDESGIGEDTVLSRLRIHCGNAYLVHRLDAGTSGVMIAAKDEIVKKQLETMFEAHCFEKTYRADVLGRMPAKQQTLNAFLLKDAASSKVRVINTRKAGAKDICTEYRVISEITVGNEVLSKLFVTIPTGRTHQIRAHMAFIGHPLLGDDKYGKRDINKKLKAKGIHLRCVELRINRQDILPEYSGMRFTCGEDERWTFRA